MLTRRNAAIGPQDIDLCNSLGAVKDEDVKDRHGVDLVIGGHDHVYYVGVRIVIRAL